jgi:hypothetical protein
VALASHLQMLGTENGNREMWSRTGNVCTVGKVDIDERIGYIIVCKVSSSRKLTWLTRP